MFVDQQPEARPAASLTDRVIADVGATMAAGAVVLGDRLGLYRALATGPLSPVELARRTRTAPRYVEEWLRGQAAAGYVEYDPTSGEYWMTPEQAKVFTDPEAVLNAPAAFQFVLGALRAQARLEAAFRTGEGIGWSEHDAAVLDAWTRVQRSLYGRHLLTRWLPALRGVEARLRRGARVAEIACGLAVASGLMARAFPASRFTAFDDHPEAVATARAAGARVLDLGPTDPRATAASVQTIADAVGESAATPTGAGLEDAGSAGAASVGPGSVGAASARAGWTGAGWPGAGWPGKLLALGSAFGPADRLRQRVATAATGAQLPGGGQLVFPGRRMVALYGHPGDPGLGVLGEQPVEAAVGRAQQLAASYQAYVGEPVVPAFEIIVTVATGRTGSRAHPVEKFRPWVQAAREAGVYVVLDLQPGDVHFLEQARLYEELLREPHVGLALDPEWRVQPGKAHMVQIGSVDAAEVNEVGQWLAQLTREHNLPQKVLMLHQFRLDMISNRSALVTDYDELRVVIHADGFGSPGAKYDTWNTLHIDAPANVAWGWKNFYDEDKPTFTPEQTMAVSPEIVFVSYQ